MAVTLMDFYAFVLVEASELKRALDACSLGTSQTWSVVDELSLLDGQHHEAVVYHVCEPQPKACCVRIELYWRSSNTMTTEGTLSLLSCVARTLNLSLLTTTSVLNDYEALLIQPCHPPRLVSLDADALDRWNLLRLV